MQTYSDRQISAFSELVSLIHSEVLTRGVWAKTLELLNDVVPSDSTALVFLDPLTGSPTGWVGRNLDDNFFHSYASQYKVLEQVVPTVVASGLTVWRPEDVLGDKKWRTCNLYRELSSVYGIRNVLTIAVKQGLGVVLWIRLLREAATHPFTDMEKDIFGLVQTHIADAVERFGQLKDDSSLIEAVLPSIKRSSKPCFVLDQNGDLAYMSESAQSLCEAAEDRQAVLAGVSQTAQVLLNNTAGFRAPTDDQPERLLFIADRIYGIAFYPLQLTDSRPQFLMFASDAGAMILLLCDRRMAAVGLSDKELRVGHMLILGQPDSEIARKMQVTVLTVKDHVCSIREKLGAANRSQVLMKLLGI